MATHKAEFPSGAFDTEMGVIPATGFEQQLAKNRKGDRRSSRRVLAFVAAFGKGRSKPPTQ